MSYQVNWLKTPLLCGICCPLAPLDTHGHSLSFLAFSFKEKLLHCLHWRYVGETRAVWSLEGGSHCRHSSEWGVGLFLEVSCKSGFVPAFSKLPCYVIGSQLKWQCPELGVNWDQCCLVLLTNASRLQNTAAHTAIHTVPLCKSHDPPLKDSQSAHWGLWDPHGKQARKMI